MKLSDSDLGRRLQILASEHASLVATRSLAWSESFSRATMFLATLSGAVVALALVAQASAFGEPFKLFALILLPIVLFVGVTTVLRMSSANHYDSLCVMGMNRIRHAYLEIAPDLAPYLVMSSHDDDRGIGITMGVASGRPSLRHLISGTPVIVGVVNSVVAGVIAVVAASRFGEGTGGLALAGGLGFFVTFALHARAAAKDVAGAITRLRPKFPSLDDAA